MKRETGLGSIGSAYDARRSDFDQWASELAALGWFRRKVAEPLVRRLHQVGRAALAPERF